jgi:hypothetical protein
MGQASWDQRRVGVRRHADQRDSEALGVGDEIGELGRAAGIGEHQKRVRAGERAQVAVACLARMDELGRGPRRRQGRRDLAPDMTALAHAADDDAPTHGHQDIHSFRERPVELIGERPHRLTGETEHAAGSQEIRFFAAR